MPPHSMYAGLARLAARAGIKIGANGNPVENPEDGTETDRDDEPENEGDPAQDPAPAGDPPADPPAGDPPADPEEDDDDETDDAGTGDDAAGNAGQQAGGGAPRRSADFRAGERYGAQQTAGRWAAVLASPVARGNLEMATDLLASSSMSPAAIVEHCDRYKGESSAKRLLDTTPKVNIGDASGKTTDAAASSRQSAVAGVNKQAGRQTAKTGVPVRRSRRAAAADTSKQQEK